MFPRKYKGPDSCEAGITATTKLEIKKKADIVDEGSHHTYSHGSAPRMEI